MRAIDLERVITAAAASVETDAAETPLFRSFASAFLSDVGDDAAGSERTLSAAAVAAFALARRRASGDIHVRVVNPSDRAGRTVIEVLQDDRPFLVDTVRLVLRRNGLDDD